MTKKLLYISVNSKPENLSSSKTVARTFINNFLEKNKNFKLEEIDLYKEHIPKLKYEYFQDRNCVISEEDAAKLPQEDQKEVARIHELCKQFMSAEMYVIAAPMWSLSFPAPLKEYIDCIVQNHMTVELEPEKKPKGLLDNLYRALVYVQSSGGNIPWFLDPVMDKGENYIASIMKTIGIRDVRELKVDNTGQTQEEKERAIKKAEAKIDNIINDLIF